MCAPRIILLTAHREDDTANREGDNNQDPNRSSEKQLEREQLWVEQPGKHAPWQWACAPGLAPDFDGRRNRNHRMESKSNSSAIGADAFRSSGVVSNSEREPG